MGTGVIWEALGWVGMALIVGAYALLSSDVVSASSPTYQLANLLGSNLLGAQLLMRRVWPAFGLQIVWSLIALIALLRISGAL